MSDQEQHGSDGEQPRAQERQAAPLPDLSARKLKKLKEKYDRRGIVYISRIPPHLVRLRAVWRPAWSPWFWLLTAPRPCALQKPQKLRQLLEQYAEIGRVYLAPEGAPPPPPAAALLPAGAATAAGAISTLPTSTLHAHSHCVHWFCCRPRAAQEAQAEGRQQRQKLHRGLGGV